MPRAERLSFRVSIDEKLSVEVAAKRAGMPVSDYLRFLIRSAKPVQDAA
ncbi:plasmid mobilization protein [Mesorhizobium yinganensis]